LIQWTASLAAYGYFRRDLSHWERLGFAAVTILGFAAMIHYHHPGQYYQYQFMYFIALAAMLTKAIRPSREARRP
jgi:hypothetical protein